jgi:predicted DNA-binding protein with PD1-like motif
MHTFAIRLTPGTDLKAELGRLTQALGLRAGCILSCVGSLTHARLRMPGAVGEAEVIRDFAEPLEILSLSGTLCADGLHVHIALSRRDGSCIGGHLVEGCHVHTTVELVIGELAEVEFHRPRDAATGYNELSVRPRRPKATRGRCCNLICS